ncbi:MULTISPECIES: hypothetical protein [Streptomyces]|uniref:hypothetical protein n=1 Tax=Streptomyces TaxID=1883 RepID=UPI001586FCD3|nr:hypothetical protein [Streptomyces sp. CAI-85]MBO7940088.1 hypothetical protein [Streptomyces sp. S9]NUV60281.1 hypothetical protein [Streptomyces sp. CAI-85]
MPDARSRAQLTAAEADVLRIVCDARRPVFVTVHSNGRRRYSHWRPLDAGTGRGGCYVALPTEACDRLHAAGRIVLGEPVTDPAKTTYRVSAARPPAAPLRLPVAAVPAPAPVRSLRARGRGYAA